MSNLRKLSMAFILALTLSSAALAGTIDCPGITQEPPTVEQSAEQEASCGDMSCGVLDVVAGIFDSVLSLV